MVLVSRNPRSLLSYFCFGALLRGLLCFCLSTSSIWSQSISAQDARGSQGTSPPKSLQDLVTGKRPPAAVQLFDGSKDHLMVSMAGLPIDWAINSGALVSTANSKRSNHLVSKLHFRDALVHVEFMLPKDSTGNSGVYLHGHYELQIINSADKELLSDADAGAVYGFSPPLMNACFQPEQWQAYNIMYRAPIRNLKGQVVKPGSIKAELNGTIVQDDLKIGEPRSRYHPYRYGTTPYLQEIAAQQKKKRTGPLFLQDHDSPVKFRNIWVLPLDDQSYLYEPKHP